MIPHHLCLLLCFMIGNVQALIFDQKKTHEWNKIENDNYAVILI